MNEYAACKDQIQLKAESSQIQELRKFQNVSRLRTQEINRRDPLEKL